MKLEYIKELAALMEEKSLTSVEVWEKDNKVILSRAAAAPPPAPAAAVPAGQHEAASAPQPAPAQGPAANDPKVLKSPLVGCVYLAPGPGADAFAPVGASVAKGQTLCIIEAMKVMNELASPADGVIAELYVENGQMVEYGQPVLRFE